MLEDTADGCENRPQHIHRPYLISWGRNEHLNERSCLSSVVCPANRYNYFVFQAEQAVERCRLYIERCAPRFSHLLYIPPLWVHLLCTAVSIRATRNTMRSQSNEFHKNKTESRFRFEVTAKISRGDPLGGATQLPYTSSYLRRDAI